VGEEVGGVDFGLESCGRGGWFGGGLLFMLSLGGEGEEGCGEEVGYHGCCVGVLC